MQFTKQGKQKNLKKAQLHKLNTSMQNQEDWLQSSITLAKYVIRLRRWVVYMLTKKDVKLINR